MNTMTAVEKVLDWFRRYHEMNGEAPSPYEIRCQLEMAIEEENKALGLGAVVGRSEQLVCDDCLSDEMDKTLRQENKCVSCGQRLAK